MRCRSSKVMSNIEGRERSQPAWSTPGLWVDIDSNSSLEKAVSGQTDRQTDGRHTVPDGNSGGNRSDPAYPVGTRRLGRNGSRLERRAAQLSLSLRALARSLQNSGLL